VTEGKMEGNLEEPSFCCMTVEVKTPTVTVLHNLRITEKHKKNTKKSQKLQKSYKKVVKKL
jgi:hypothetical protein